MSKSSDFTLIRVKKNINTIQHKNNPYTVHLRKPEHKMIECARDN